MPVKLNVTHGGLSCLQESLYFTGYPRKSLKSQDKRYGKPRIADLQTIVAKVRFLSVEPLLEDLGVLSLSGIHWVIVGGGSGPKARIMKEAWVTSIRDQCSKNGVGFFFKQWGTWGVDGVRRSKKANGRSLDGRTWDAIPVISVE